MIDKQKAIEALEANNYNGLSASVVARCIQIIRELPDNAEKNNPLTLEELREMDGEPVYLDVDVWVLVKYDVGDPFFVFNDGDNCNAKLWYEKIGPAYRHKPERVDNT